MEELKALESAYVLGLVDDEIATESSVLNDRKLQNSLYKIFKHVFDKYIKIDQKFKSISWDIDYYGNGVHIVYRYDELSKSEKKIILMAQKIIISKMREMINDDKELSNKVSVEPDPEYLGALIFVSTIDSEDVMNVKEVYKKLLQYLTKDIQLLQSEIKSLVSNLRSNSRFMDIKWESCKVQFARGPEITLNNKIDLGYLEIPIFDEDEDPKELLSIIHKDFDKVFNKLSLKYTKSLINGTYELTPYGVLKDKELNDRFQQYN